MKVWIDAAAGGAAIFGLTPVERLLRAVGRVTPQPSEILLSGGTPPTGVPADLPVRQRMEQGPAGARLQNYLAGAGEEPVLVLDGASLVDDRLIALLAGQPAGLCAVDGEGEERTAVLLTSSAAAGALSRESRDVPEIAEGLLAAGLLRLIAQTEFPSFIKHLRRDLPFYLQRLPDADSAGRAERFLFHSNYKGSTDFLTKWVYPPLVWRLTRLATRHAVHPNLITLVSILLTFLAVPLFASGQWVAGFLAAYAMSILDSVDGKVARVTLTDSAIGNLMDHGLDIVHPPFWYFAIAWGLTGGDVAAPAFQAAILLVGFYIADRLVLSVSKWRWGYGLHAHAPIDGRIRTWIARRNTNLVLLTLGYLVGQLEAAFYLVVIWQGLTLVWHAGRTLWLLRTKPATR
jgi:phosphatidylglycerophosphate synthase